MAKTFRFDFGDDVGKAVGESNLVSVENIDGCLIHDVAKNGSLATRVVAKGELWVDCVNGEEWIEWCEKGAKVVWQESGPIIING